MREKETQILNLKKYPTQAAIMLFSEKSLLQAGW